ncbi:MAG: DNA-binding response regulator [Bdellovibrionales bacterium RIFOXYD1_FULL_53_11]|nr:MAG: DNA-binding response regulator [Bdellovibrionales bacterium RIFOXYD1_FULL_53_11]
MRILVVDDEKKMVMFLKKGLVEAGYSVDVAQSVSSADALQGANDYDLILLDVMLPDGNGFDAARKFRSDGYAGQILLLTAMSSTKDKVRGLDSGADDYLTKPFSFDELLARVRALLRRSGTAQSPMLEYGVIKMDLVKRVVRIGSDDAALTAKEFALLEYFLRNADRPVSRTELSEHVWDIHFDPGSNVIDVYINNLRKKIAQHTKNKYIHTVVGVGYALRKE